jgi:hypothetical protein
MASIFPGGWPWPDDESLAIKDSDPSLVNICLTDYVILTDTDAE